MFTLYGGDHVVAPQLQGLALVTWRLFTTAIRLMSDPRLVAIPRNIDLAEEFIQCFIENCVIRFEKKFVAYVVHLLTHLPAEVRKFGALDKFSCFKYENVLKTLKGLSTSTRNPLSNLSKHLKVQSTYTSKPTRVLCDSGDPPILKQRHWTKNCQIKGAKVKQYRGIAFNCILLTTKPPNCYFHAKSQLVMRLRNVCLDTDGSIYLLASRFNKTSSAYTIDRKDNTQWRSKQIGLCKLGKLDDTRYEIILLSEVDYKCVVHVIENVVYCYPLLNL